MSEEYEWKGPVFLDILTIPTSTSFDKSFWMDLFKSSNEGGGERAREVGEEEEVFLVGKDIGPKTESLSLPPSVQTLTIRRNKKIEPTEESQRKGIFLLFFQLLPMGERERERGRYFSDLFFFSLRRRKN